MIGAGNSVLTRRIVDVVCSLVLLVFAVPLQLSQSARNFKIYYSCVYIYDVT